MRKATPTLALRKTARIHNRATDTFLERIEFPRYPNKKGRIELSPSIINEPRLFAKHLRDAGAILPINRSDLKALLDATAAAPCEQQFVYAAQTGWILNKRAFVRTHGIVGNSSSTILGFRRSDRTDPRGLIKHGGTVASWKRSIGKAATSSSILMFTISAALAAPLLKIVGRTSFGFCLFAASRSGKTLATVAAGSVIGIGSSRHMLDWNATDARLQEQLPEFNDSMMPIDDFMSMKGTDREKYARIKTLAYIIALGSGTGRHSSSSQKANDSWRSIVLTSNERSIRDLALRSRAEREPGEAIRLIDVPATFDGFKDIFDRAPALSFEQLFAYCERNHGYVFESFLDHLIAKRARLRGLIRRHLNAFATIVSDDADGNFARDVAEKFGLVYAAGELGIEFGLLPWNSDDLREAISKCYFASRDLLPDQGVIVRSGYETLKSYLKKLPEGNMLTRSEGRSSDGFRETLPGHYRCVLKRDSFNSIFASVAQQELVTSQLIRMRRITLAKVSNGPAQIKEQHFWPDGERRRSVEILWPRIIAGSDN